MQDNITRYSEKNIENLLCSKLGNKYKEYRELRNNVDYNNIPSFPIHIDFELNDRCNQSCIMCPRNISSHPDINYGFDSTNILSFEVFKKIIDEGANNNLKSINVDAFSEPLLNDDVFNMVSYAKEKGIIDTRLITNGLLLEKNIENIFSSKLVNLFVSIDAYSEENYSKIRGIGFKKVISGLERLLEEKKRRNSILPIVRVSFVNMDSNSVEKDDFINYWKNKVDFIDIKIFDDYNVNIKNDFDMSIKKKWDCFSPFSRLAVLSNGDVLSCCNFFGKNIPISNININNNIKTIWNSKKLSNIRKVIINDTLKNCSICQRVG
jgi:radical SAM protein with 4Fe4S-binding SPASM domain